MNEASVVDGIEVAPILREFLEQEALPGSGVAAAQNYWRNHSPVLPAKGPSGAAA